MVNVCRHSRSDVPRELHICPLVHSSICPSTFASAQDVTSRDELCSSGDGAFFLSKRHEEWTLLSHCFLVEAHEGCWLSPSCVGFGGGGTRRMSSPVVCHTTTTHRRGSFSASALFAGTEPATYTGWAERRFRLFSASKIRSLSLASAVVR